MSVIIIFKWHILSCSGPFCFLNTETHSHNDLWVFVNVCVCARVRVLLSVPLHCNTGSALSNSSCDWLTAPTGARQGRLFYPITALFGSALCIATRTLSLGRKEAKEKEAVSAPQSSQRTGWIDWFLLELLLPDNSAQLHLMITFILRNCSLWTEFKFFLKLISLKQEACEIQSDKLTGFWHSCRSGSGRERVCSSRSSSASLESLSGLHEKVYWTLWNEAPAASLVNKKPANHMRVVHHITDYYGSCICVGGFVTTLPL